MKIEELPCFRKYNVYILLSFCAIMGHCGILAQKHVTDTVEISTTTSQGETIKYFVSLNTMTIADARSYCGVKHSQVLTVNSKEEFELIKRNLPNFIQYLTRSKGLWLDYWKPFLSQAYIDSFGVPVAYTNWIVAPKLRGSKYQYNGTVYIQIWNGKWVELINNPNAKHFAICQRSQNASPVSSSTLEPNTSSDATVDSKDLTRNNDVPKWLIPTVASTVVIVILVVLALAGILYHISQKKKHGQGMGFQALQNNEPPEFQPQPG